jgi:D-amino-acid dehydrogenase
LKVIVLGAGVVGISTAWFLNRAGHEVTVIDRQNAAALETSYANGGQISAGQTEPWAGPGAPIKLIKWWFREDSPLLFRPQLDWQQWRWGLQFALECLPGRTRHNIVQMMHIAAYSLATLRKLREDTGIEYDHLSRGILQIYYEKTGFDEACRLCELYRRYGVRREPKSVAEAVAIEPSLSTIAPRLAGATHAPEDETGDARMFTQGLAQACAQVGVEFRYGVAIEHLVADGARVTGVQIASGESGPRREARTYAETLAADAYVVALGSYSPLLLKPIGVPALIYPAKGYSATMPLVDPSKAPNMSVTDETAKMVFTRLGNRLRVAGTAELNGYSTELNSVRCEALTRRARELFPDSCDWSGAEYWTGLRPSTPSNVPLIGPTRYPNLYLNTGHGTLGWTMGPGSGKALADLMSGRRPAVDFDFLGMR